MPLDTLLHRRAADLFADALDLAAPEREALLNDSGIDPEVVAEVRSLLAVHDGAEAGVLAPLERPHLASPEDLVGRTVGPWRLDGVLGVGGMGVVYAAARVAGGFEQAAALKRVRPGVGPDFHARFLRERTVLAGLDHPGVARLLDGGLDAEGIPYLAMERADGEPITTYAGARSLGLDARIRLFLQACDAVAHAHHHLVVHRDLKPAHVLVTEDERGEARVKLLDFGIAKLLEDDADEGITRTGGGPLTPQYAAPEQVLGQPVTTATDVYALGVVLYELLTGQRPYDVAGMPPSASARVVAETVPTRPSASGVTVVDPRRLRGDLDTVVMKALAKEPGRRYLTADALADDLRRALDGLPVQARPDSAGYRARLFVRRHRTAVVAAALVLAALVGGLGVALWQAAEARAETAKAQAVQEFLLGMLGAVDPDADGRDVRVADLLDRAAATLDSTLRDQPDVRADAHARLGQTYHGLGLFVEAEGQYRQALLLRERLDGPTSVATATAQRDLAVALRERAEYDLADSLLSRSLATLRDRRGDRSEAVATTLAEIGTLRYLTGDGAGSIAAHRQVLAIEESLFEPNALQIVLTLGNLAVALFDSDLDESTALLERQAGLYRRYHAADESGLANTLANLGAAYAEADRYAEAAEVQTEAVALFRSSLGDEHPSTGFGLNNLGASLTALGRPAEALPLLEESIAIYRTALGADHPNIGFPLNNVAKALRDLGQRAEAERALDDAERLFRAGFGPDHPVLDRVTETRASLDEPARGSD